MAARSLGVSAAYIFSAAVEIERPASVRVAETRRVSTLPGDASRDASSSKPAGFACGFAVRSSSLVVQRPPTNSGSPEAFAGGSEGVDQPPVVLVVLPIGGCVAP